MIPNILVLFLLLGCSLSDVQDYSVTIPLSSKLVKYQANEMKETYMLYANLPVS